MATFILVPGAGGAAWTWHRVAERLAAAGHEAIAVDLPGDDPAKGLHAYADRVVDAIGARRDVVLVAQSLGGFTAACVASHPALRRIVFVNAMIPKPHETPGAWWGNTGSEAARLAAARAGGYGETFDLDTYFLHDVPPELVRASAAHARPEAKVVFADEARFDGWPDVPVRVVFGKDDRFFPRLPATRRAGAPRRGRGRARGARRPPCGARAPRRADRGAGGTMRQALAHVALLVRDYDEAIAWYAEKLGFELVADEAEDAKRWVVMRPRGAGDGATDLVLAQATPAQISAVGNQAGDRVFLFLRTDDFWRDHAAMTAKGVRFVREPKVEPYGTVAVFGGPVRKSLGPDRPVTMWRRGIEHAASALLHRLHHA